MYIWVIGRSLPEVETGMMGIFEYEQAVALRDNDHRVVYTYCDMRSIKHQKHFCFKKFLKDSVSIYGYHLPLGGIPKKLLESIKYIYFKRTIKNIIDNEGLPDIIHIHFPLISLNVKMWNLIKGLGRPVVITEHWTKVQEKEITKSNHMLLEEIVNVSAAVICVSEQLKNSVVDLTKTQKKVYVIPNMVNSTIKYKPKEKVQDTFEFITVGRLVPHKCFNIVIDAFAKAFKDNEFVKLTIIGDGDQFENLKHQINDLKLNNSVKMTGYISREDIGQYYNQCDAFVSASTLETFGVPFIEAMMCGKPVICTKGSPIETYVNSSNGLKFDANDSNNLASAMIEIYRNRNSYIDREISDNAVQKFSANAIAQKLESVFNLFV